MTGMVFSSIFVVADGMMVGRGIGAEGLAAVNIVSPLFTLSTGWGLMFGTGGSVLAARVLSRNDRKGANTAAAISLAVSGLSVLAVISLMLCFPHATVKILSAPEELETQVLEYFYPIALAIFFNVIMNVGLFFIRLDGSPGYAMGCIAAGAVMNIGLDWLFVFPLRMGLEGAALATLITQIASVAMMLWYIFRKASVFRAEEMAGIWKSMPEKKKTAAQIASVGFPAFLGDISISLMTITGNITFARYLGTDGVAAFSIICFIMPILFMAYNAVIQSAQPIISFNLAMSPERARKSLTLAFSVTLAAGAGFTAATWADSGMIASLFLEQGTEAYGIAAEGLKLFALAFLPTGMNILAVGWLQSAGNGRLSTLVTVLRGIVFMAAAFIILPGIMGERGIWLAVPAAELLAMFLIIAGIRTLLRPLKTHP